MDLEDTIYVAPVLEEGDRLIIQPLEVRHSRHGSEPSNRSHAMTPTDQGALPSGGLQTIISWFARNHVAANLLMLAVVATGLLVSQNIRQEIYPTFTLDVVEITMEYRGASPEDVEQSIILPIESELRSMEIIREITATASEGSARISAELVPGSDRNRGLQEITAAVQRINLFPDEAEPPTIALDNGRRRG